MRLDELADRMGDRITIEWKSFMLRPAPEERDREAFVRYTEKWLVAAEMEPAAGFSVWTGDNDPPSHSPPALAAAKLAEQYGPGAAHDYRRGLFRAYFSENRTISDRAVQVSLAADAGIDPDEFASQLAEQEPSLTTAVVADHREAISLGITAVPTVVMAGALAIPGAQDVETYERLASRLIAKASEPAG